MKLLILSLFIAIPLIIFAGAIEYNSYDGNVIGFGIAFLIMYYIAFGSLVALFYIIKKIVLDIKNKKKN